MKTPSRQLLGPLWRRLLPSWRRAMSSSTTLTEDKPQVSSNGKHAFSETAASLIKSNYESFRQGKVHSQATIIEPSAASLLFSNVVVDIRDEDTIVEINPGLGFLTKLLVENTCNKLLLFEPREGFRESLSHTFSKEIDRGRITLSEFNFINFYSYYVYHINNNNTDVIKKFLTLFPDQKHPSQSNVRVLGVIEDRRFFSRLALSLMLSVSFFEKNSPTFYIYTTDKLYKRFFTPFPFVYHNSNFKHSLQNNFMFTFSHLTAESSPCFYPLLKKKRQFSNIDTSIYHLVKIEPAWDFLSKMCREERELFMFFLMQLTRLPQQNLLLQTTERWLPDFGVSLIDAGFRVFTYSQELNREEVMFVYHMFRHHPNFSESSFVKEKDAWIRSCEGYTFSSES